MGEPTKQCRACKEDIKATAKKCPHCHTIQSTLVNVTIAVIVALVVCGLFAILGLGLYADHDTRGLLDEVAQGLTVKHSTMHFTDSGDRTYLVVVGKMYNTTGRAWTEPYLHVDFYDEKGGLIDACYSRDSDLLILPDAETTFHVICLAARHRAEYVSHKVAVRSASRFRAR